MAQECNLINALKTVKMDNERGEISDGLVCVAARHFDSLLISLGQGQRSWMHGSDTASGTGTAQQ